MSQDVHAFRSLTIERGSEFQIFRCHWKHETNIYLGELPSSLGPYVGTRMVEFTNSIVSPVNSGSDGPTKI